MKKNVRANILLTITALIWGTAFVAQVQGMDHVGPFTFIFARNIIAGIFLLLVIKVMDMNRKGKNNAETPVELENRKKQRRDELIGGFFCGTVLFVAMSLQQVGILDTTAGKAGFITSLYIVLVPVLGIFIGKKVNLRVWVCVFIAAFGLYLLSVKGGFTLGRGDTFVLLCAFAYSLHILVIDYFSPKGDGVVISCVQFFVASVFSAIAMLLREQFVWSEVMAAAIPILYAAIMSSGVGYTLQIVAQKDTSPTIASLLMSLEAPFALVAGIILLAERPTLREYMGTIIMFAAIIIAQLPSKNQKIIEENVDIH